MVVYHHWGISATTGERVTHKDPSPSTSGAATTRDIRLDSLKGLAILGVLTLHLVPVKFMSTSPALVPHGLALLSVAVYQASRMAVPVLVLVSLYLFATLRPGRSHYLARRLRRIGSVLVVWLVVYATLGVAVGARESFSSIGSVLAYPFTDSLLYFLTDLMLMTAIVEVLARAADALPERMGTAVLHAIFWASIAALGVAEVLAWHPRIWSLVNFLPYAPAALLLQKRRFGRWTAPAGFAASLAAEAWLISSGRLHLGGTGYARPMFVFAALLLFAFWSESDWARMPTLARIGASSLGIYLVHPLVAAGLRRWAGFGASEVAVSWGTVELALGLTASTVVVTALTLVLLNKTPARRFVR